jgi:hypothetical protein
MSAQTCPACGATVPGGVAQCLRCRAALGDAPAETEACAPRYRVFAFVAGRGGPMFGVFVALALGLVAAVVLGAVAGVVRHLFWIVLLFPVGFGCGVGYLTSLGARLAKCRRVPMVHGAGVLVGFLGAAVMHLTLFQVRVAANPALEGTSFFQYLDLLCQAGVLGFGYTGTAIYYAVEVGLIVLMTAGMAAEALNDPFCDECNRWKRNEALGKFKIHAAVVAAAVAAGQPEAMVAPAVGDDTVNVELFRCPDCHNDGPVEVRLSCSRTVDKGVWTAKVFVTYPGAAAPEFEAAARDCRERELEVK